MKITAIIMASGYSRRMGENKLLLKCKDKTFIQHTLDKVKKCDFYSRIIVARDKAIVELAESLDFKTVKNKRADKGQSEAIKLGLNNSPISDGYMFFTSDQPLLDIETIELLMDTFNKNNNSIIVPRFKGRKGSPVIFSSKFLKELTQLQGDTGGKKIINAHKESIIFVEVKKEEVLMDVDTWEDYYDLNRFGKNL
ncbi:molybdenum cofactor cytidylyltransferase [Clostridium pasteurianum]|uniref:Molybdenum hydroxylase accessory protein, YgfJ family n=1 Tax=Clostridium pasteurianum BC1 TaxID=86416 RepID=R4JXE5_CLOPA|nr:molybdenum cofactor cytidylyltransferase [Clostridium pasteurianum]AGK95487.1 molybdenum hydroxylase accessory protein, YgfJ family [Clostridium pasteurianum BC1]